ncbi:hypothetical protein GCM10011348_32210 [Marinobacterium nitratireducens]|uniref:Flagellar hook protein FlgE n=1 Tax=Marinobacterium nitratireducens TaxID=518897 RepID=A0A917ZJL7_9GAMM|nr:flagellar hook-basal body complex protein [Marinobacterium nitratireducens]GGO84903.1 hypothetical protein GCM10011348_32210 [Marinobacterium nitratireducens]
MAGFNTAITGLKAASTDLDVTGNNIANSSTVGFKASRTEFADIYATAVVGAGSSNIAGSGVTVSDIAQDFSAGTIEFTNNNLDLAINGAGFFQLDDGQGGVTYTRAGAFELDKDGNIVSKNGSYLQGYGLDADGNLLPVGNLAVTEKESPPKATESIDLSFNIDSREDATLLTAPYDKDDPGSFTYSTTVRTFDSLGNEHTVKFNFVEQRPVREVYSFDGDTATLSGIAGVGASALAGDPDLRNALVAADPRIDPESFVYDAVTDTTTFEFYAEATASGDMILGTGASAEALTPIERPSNEVHNYVFDDSVFSAGVDGNELANETSVEIGGIPVVLSAGSTKADVGTAIEASQGRILEANPDVESVVFDGSGIVITFKADAGNVDTLPISFASGDEFWDLDDPAVPVTIEGDNSFQGVYRTYAYLNGEQQLDLGKAVDPGEPGSSNVPPLTEVGPVIVEFDPTNGLLTSVNGRDFVPGANVPPITISGADPADPNTQISLDITNTTQFASASIVKSQAQDGYTKGDLIGVSFGGNGEMVASFSNGQNQSLGVVAIATFENQSGLQPSGDTEWTATLDSGDAVINPPGTGLNGSLRSAALEQSNVDLSAELVNLIEAQRNFQANSKTLETLNTVTQTILQI